jgi:hypothetical protein
MCPDCSSPAAGSRDGTTADVYVRTPSGAIVTGSVRADGAFGGYTVLGGVTSSSPAVVTAKRDINRVDLVILMPEEQRPGELHYGTWWKTRTF